MNALTVTMLEWRVVPIATFVDDANGKEKLMYMMRAEDEYKRGMEMQKKVDLSHGSAPDMTNEDKQVVVDHKQKA